MVTWIRLLHTHLRHSVKRGLFFFTVLKALYVERKKIKWDVLSSFLVASLTLYGSLILGWPITEIIIFIGFIRYLEPFIV